MFARMQNHCNVSFNQVMTLVPTLLLARPLLTSTLQIPTSGRVPFSATLLAGQEGHLQSAPQEHLSPHEQPLSQLQDPTFHRLQYTWIFRWGTHQTTHQKNEWHCDALTARNMPLIHLETHEQPCSQVQDPPLQRLNTARIPWGRHQTS